MTLQEAVEVLNRNNHRGITRWKAHEREGAVCWITQKDTTETRGFELDYYVHNIEEPEVVLIARYYLDREPNGVIAAAERLVFACQAIINPKTGRHWENRTLFQTAFQEHNNAFFRLINSAFDYIAQNTQKSPMQAEENLLKTRDTDCHETNE